MAATRQAGQKQKQANQRRNQQREAEGLHRDRVFAVDFRFWPIAHSGMLAPQWQLSTHCRHSARCYAALMKKSVRSRGTRFIRLGMKALFIAELALAAALILCFVADAIGLQRERVGNLFPSIVVLIVYTALAMLLLRIALTWSHSRDRR